VEVGTWLRNLGLGGSTALAARFDPKICMIALLATQSARAQHGRALPLTASRPNRRRLKPRRRDDAGSGAATGAPRAPPTGGRRAAAAGRRAACAGGRWAG
jgi:hypothetical protein